MAAHQHQTRTMSQYFDAPCDHPVHGGNTGNHVCRLCFRPFGRRDSLLRHMRVHDTRRSLKTRKRTACLACSKSKIRCTGDQPSCASCQRRCITCTYNSDANAKSPAIHLATFDGSNGSTSSESQQSQESETTVVVEQSAPPSYQDVTNILYPPPRKDYEMGLLPDNSTPYSTDYFQNDHELALEATDLNSNLEWLFDTPSQDFDTNLADPFTIGDPAPFDTPIRNPAVGGPNDQGLALGAGSFSRERSASVERDRTNLRLPSPQAEDDCSPDDPWPMEWHAEPSKHSSELPAIGGDEDESTKIYARSFSTWTLRSSTLDALKYYLKLPERKSPWSSINLTNFPSNEKLGYCIDRYFAHFHSTFPVIHQPTFDPAKDLTVTLAIASIGALYTRLSGARAFSNTLSELNRRLLLFLAEYDRRYVRSEPYLTAQVLQGLHGYCSGNKRLFELSESFRSTLVHHAKCLGLFRHKPEQGSSPIVGGSIERAWKDWIHQERLCRIAWAVFEYDAAVAYQHNNRPYLSVSEIHLNLPCISQLWAAESAYCWLSMLPTSGASPVSPRFDTTIRMFFDKTLNPGQKVKDERHRYMFVLTLVRMIWTHKEMRASPVIDLKPLGLESTTSTLLAAVDSMLQSPEALKASLTTTELAGAVHTQQLIYVAHLYGAGDLMNWLYPLLRKDDNATAALVRMKHWAKERPEVVRDVAYYSARILALARIYPSNSANEPALIFHAGTVLSHIAKLLPTNSCEKIVVWLDYMGPESDAESVRLKSWLRNGQAQTISLHGVPSLCSDEGRRQILDHTADLLKRRDVWGIAESFVKVVLMLRDAHGR